METILRRAATLFALLALVACSGTAKDSAPNAWGGPLSELRVQWASAADVDLTSGVAVPIRAYVESRWVAQWHGSLDFAYPGFEEAVPPNAEGDAGADARRPETTTQATPFYGTSTHRILDLDGRSPTITATLCTYTYAMAKKNDDGTFFSVARTESAEPRGVFTTRVILDPNGADPNASQPKQSGPNPAPSENVFGSWTVTAFLSEFAMGQPGFAEAWPTYQADLQRCADLAPDPPQRRAFLTQGDHPRSDFPTLPASPGWPGSSQ
jgi:hypothetical protein